MLIEKLSDTGKIYLCSDYDNRPEECKNHVFSSPICPIGADSLGIKNQKKLNARMEAINAVINESSFEDCEF